MNSKSLWMFLLILQCGIVTPRPAQSQGEPDHFTHQQYSYDALNKPKDESNNDQVISVRITSSVAVGGIKTKSDFNNTENTQESLKQNTFPTLLTTTYATPSINNIEIKETVTTELPPNLIGANIEFIRQLNAKKEAKGHHTLDQVHPFQFHQDLNGTENTEPAPVTPSTNFENQDEDSIAEPSIKNIFGIDDKSYEYKSISEVKPMVQSPPHNQVNKKDVNNVAQSYIPGTEPIFDLHNNNDTDDSIAASSVESIITAENEDKDVENLENVPLARSIPFSPSSKNYIQGLTNKAPSERGNSVSLTTVSFDIVHETPKQPTNYNNMPSTTYTHSDQGSSNSNQFYETPKVYSQPAQIYSEPAKFYSEPAKIYSEPAKIYSEPAKVYSEPAKIYSEPAKFYSPAASLNLPPETLPNYTPWQVSSQNTAIPTTIPTTPTVVPLPSDIPSSQRAVEQRPEKNYEVDEKVSVITDGRSHGVQESSTEKCKQENCKVGYVVEGRQYKKYRVEERTPDGFIVGEYGVVRNEDGALRGVRYTADGDASPRLIYDALMKFLQL
ncbi:uncharacterized protein LOC114355474 [Ostrinia furnacalis]|uniref:uncharacterized protein LOC114355474 n=1 Tax=Ostrinia furnacalis TaxID=93504 RepID=UPI00103D00C2|nr:uncharacterized protein LOC114355474 [Ostrinia furnacalis]